MLITPISVNFNKKNIAFNKYPKVYEKKIPVEDPLYGNSPFLDCRRVSFFKKWAMSNEIIELNKFAKEANKQIILISKKDNLIIMKMRPLKKDSTFFQRLFGLDTSIGYYYTKSGYPPLELAALLLKDQQTSIDGGDREVK